MLVHSMAESIRVCVVCGDSLPKYKLDRQFNEHCSYECYSQCRTFEAGAAIGFALMCMALWCQDRMVLMQMRELWCEPGIHSFGHGDTCVYCGFSDGGANQ